ncbi:MAG TPA: hypothetical protein VFC14_15580 [Burkholderiales bacterium]|jgi:hypothetical protein|nr:hypothetical protein [Burkholderiales bacterium]
MKSLIACLVAVLGLAGCVAVPYGGYPEPAGYYYGPPAPAVSFSYSYRDGYRGGGYRHHRY